MMATAPKEVRGLLLATKRTAGAGAGRAVVEMGVCVQAEAWAMEVERAALVATTMRLT